MTRAFVLPLPPLPPFPPLPRPPPLPPPRLASEYIEVQTRSTKAIIRTFMVIDQSRLEYLSMSLLKFITNLEKS